MVWGLYVSSRVYHDHNQENGKSSVQHNCCKILVLLENHLLGDNPQDI